MDSPEHVKEMRKILTGMAAIGFAFEKHGSSWAGIMNANAKSLADLIKPLL